MMGNGVGVANNQEKNDQHGPSSRVIRAWARFNSGTFLVDRDQNPADDDDSDFDDVEVSLSALSALESSFDGYIDNGEKKLIIDQAFPSNAVPGLESDALRTAPSSTTNPEGEHETTSLPPPIPPRLPNHRDEMSALDALESARTVATKHICVAMDTLSGEMNKMASAHWTSLAAAQAKQRESEETAQAVQVHNEELVQENEALRLRIAELEWSSNVVHDKNQRLSAEMGLLRLLAQREMTNRKAAERQQALAEAQRDFSASQLFGLRSMLAVLAGDARPPAEAERPEYPQLDLDAALQRLRNEKRSGRANSPQPSQAHAVFNSDSNSSDSSDSSSSSDSHSDESEGELFGSDQFDDDSELSEVAFTVTTRTSNGNSTDPMSSMDCVEVAESPQADATKAVGGAKTPRLDTSSDFDSDSSSDYEDDFEDEEDGVSEAEEGMFFLQDVAERSWESSRQADCDDFDYIPIPGNDSAVVTRHKQVEQKVKHKKKQARRTVRSWTFKKRPQQTAV